MINNKIAERQVLKRLGGFCVFFSSIGFIGITGYVTTMHPNSSPQDFKPATITIYQYGLNESGKVMQVSKSSVTAIYPIPNIP